jgi:predicted nucleotidyltransferase
MKEERTNEKIIYKLKVGSHLYGLNIPESDTDYTGVFLQKSENILGTHKVKELDLSTNKTNTKNTNDDIDEKYHALDHFLYMLGKNNPTVLEYLYPQEECLLQDSEIMRELRENTDKIISKRVWNSFTGYAYAQRKKMVTKRERFLNLQKGIKLCEERDWDLEDKCYTLTEEDASILNEILKYYKGAKNDTRSFTKGHSLQVVYGKIVDEYNAYGYRLHTDSFKKLQYDCKHGMHLLRLLYEGKELMETGKLTFPIPEPYRSEMMDVRNGKVSYEELLTKYEKYYTLCEEAYKGTILRDKPDFKFIDQFQHRVYLKHIKEEEIK